jgi:hypothetical protein
MNTQNMQSKTNRMSKWASCLGTCALLCCLALAQSGHVQAAGARASFDRLADTKATMHNWQLARDYERQMRYELARQHYLLALASCRSESTQTQLRRELESVDLQIRTMR